MIFKAVLFRKRSTNLILELRWKDLTFSYDSHRSASVTLEAARYSGVVSEVEALAYESAIRGANIRRHCDLARRAKGVCPRFVASAAVSDHGVSVDSRYIVSGECGVSPAAPIQKDGLRALAALDAKVVRLRLALDGWESWWNDIAVVTTRQLAAASELLEAQFWVFLFVGKSL